VVLARATVVLVWANVVLVVCGALVVLPAATVVVPVSVLVGLPVAIVVARRCCVVDWLEVPDVVVLVVA
jgi:hypothetical protein